MRCELAPAALSFVAASTLLAACATPNPKTDPWGALEHYRAQIWANPTDLSDDDSVAQRIEIDRARIGIWRDLLVPTRARLIELIEHGERAKALQLGLALADGLLEPSPIQTGTSIMDDLTPLTTRALEVGLGLEGPNPLPLIESVLRWRGLFNQLLKEQASTYSLDVVRDELRHRAHAEMQTLIDVGDMEAAMQFGADMQSMYPDVGRELCGELSLYKRLKTTDAGPLPMLVEPYLERARTLRHTHPRLAQLYARAAALNAALVGRTVASLPSIEVEEPIKTKGEEIAFQPRPFPGVSVPVTVRSLTGCPAHLPIAKELRAQLEREPKGTEPPIEVDIEMTRCLRTETDGPERRFLEDRVAPRTTTETREIIDFTLVDECRWHERCKVFQAGGRPCPDHLTVYDWYCRKVKKPVGTHRESRQTQVLESTKVVVVESIHTVAYDLAAKITVRHAGQTQTSVAAKRTQGTWKNRNVDGFDEPFVPVGVSPDAARREALGALLRPASASIRALRGAAIASARASWQAEEAARKKLVADELAAESARYERMKAAHQTQTDEAFRDGALDRAFELALQGREQYGTPLTAAQRDVIRKTIQTAPKNDLLVDKRRFERDLQDQLTTTRAATEMNICGHLVPPKLSYLDAADALARDAAELDEAWQAELDALTFKKERAAIRRQPTRRSR